MKKRQLFSLIITALILCTLLPTLAFAATIDDNPEGTTLAEFASGDTMATNNGVITTNNGTITTNNGAIINNFGTVTNGVRGTVDNNYGGTVDYGSVNHWYHEVAVTGDEHATVTGLTTVKNKQWIEESKTAVFGPTSGYTITAATATGSGTITKGTDGKWTLTGVTAATNVTLTVTAATNVTLTVTAAPKTGVNRDTGILTALALVSGLVLVTALTKKKTGA